MSMPVEGINLTMQHVPATDSFERRETVVTERSNGPLLNEATQLNVEPMESNIKKSTSACSHRDSGFGHEFYRKLAEARELTNDHFEYGWAVCSIVLGSLFGLGFLLLTTAIPVAMIWIGSAHLNDCPHSPELPILLIVSGCILAAGSLINICDQLLEGYVYHTSGKRQSIMIRAINCLVIGLMLACLILGCIWIHGRNLPHENRFFDDAGMNRPVTPIPEHLYRSNQTVPPIGERANRMDPQFCHPVLYQFSYWLLNISFIVLALIALLTCIGMMTANFIP